MIAEFLLVFACTNGHPGCTETSNQYFAENPKLKQYFDTKAEKTRQYLGPTLVDTLGPVLFVASGGRGTVNLGHHFSLQFTKGDGRLSFRWDF
jgi:hypothetical protein